MTDDTPDAEELLQQSKTQKRHETDPADITVADEPTLVDAVADAYASDISENLTIRDGNLAALFAGLEETGELEAVIEAAADDWTTTDGTSKAEALRLLVRVALGEVAPETLEAGAKGYQQFRESQDYEFLKPISESLPNPYSGYIYCIYFCYTTWRRI